MEHFLFKYLAKEKHIVSLVGAGGKTTIMYQLAQHFADQGKKVLVSTTTHILKPQANFAGNLAEVKALWQEGKYVVVGNVEKVTGKLVTLPKDLWQEYCSLADLILLEADGAKGLPCKAPAEHEPVLLPESDVVLGVVGLDALNKQVQEVCFRLAEVTALLGVTPEVVLNEDAVVKLLLSNRGTRKAVGERKYFIVLNKCDTLDAKGSAEKITALLQEEGFDLRRLWIRGEAVDGGKDCIL